MLSSRLAGKVAIVSGWGSVAWAVVYLASDEATWVTGGDFSIDGGATAW